MKKLMEKFDVRMIVAIIVAVAMTCIGVSYMEYDWCEPMSGIIWLAGEIMIVGLLAYKPTTKFLADELKVLYEKLLELED